MATHDPTHRRSATRAPVERPIKLQFDDSMEVIEGLCRNISIGGMFIIFESSRLAGSLVRFELELADGNAIRGLGEVVWMRSKTEHGPEAGFGLKFRFLEQRDRQLIFKLVSQHIKDRLSRRDSEASAAPAAAATLSEAIAIPPEPSPAESRPATPGPSAAPDSAGPDLAEPEFVEPPLTAPEPAAASAESAFEPPALDRLEAREPSSLAGGRSPAAPIDLDPTVGDTPIYELGLDPEPREQASAELDVGVGDEAVPASTWQDDDAPEAEVGEPAASSSRARSLLPIAALLLLVAAAGFYLFFKDRLPSGASDAPEVVEAASGREVAGGAPAAAPRPAAPSPAGEAVEEEPPPAAGPPPPSAPAAARPGAAPPPTAQQAPPPSAQPAPPPAAAPPPIQPASAADAGAGFSRLIDVSWSEIPGGLKVVLTADGPISTGRYRYFHLAGDAPREVIKLFGVREGFGRSQLNVGGPAVQRIRTGFHRVSGGNEQHVVIDLLGPRWTISEVRNLGPRLEFLISER